VITWTTSTLFLTFLVVVRRICATCRAAVKPIQAGASTVLIVLVVRRPCPSRVAEYAGTSFQGRARRRRRGGLVAL
jgi:hypothetical protein